MDKFSFKKKVRKIWFTSKVVEEWNNLSKYVRSEVTMVEIFKGKLENIMEKDGVSENSLLEDAITWLSSLFSVLISLCTFMPLCI